MAAIKHREGDPLVGYYFQVLVDKVAGKYEAGFENVSGLDVKIETEPVTEGGMNKYTRKLPKALQYSNLVLRRGMITKASPLMTWINKAVQEFKIEPRRIQVNLLDEKGRPSINWSFFNAYPVAIKFSDLNSRDEKYAVETLEFAYDYYERKDIIT